VRKLDVETATVLSLGAGVQSSALLLMSDRGDCEIADFAVFADTQVEPPEVYAWLDYLQSKVSIPVYRTTKGDIVADTLAEGRSASLPYFTRDASGKPGIAQRQCTKEYKLEPVYKEIRRELGYKPGERVKHEVRVLVGISCDESHRMKAPMHPWVTNVYPLVDQWKSRAWAREYVEDKLGMTPPRSACFICPYHSNVEWRDIRSKSPDLWQRAVEFDRQIRRRPMLDADCYLHSDRVPLDQVDLTENRAQLDMFGNECEGMCGV
jgi:hypothetical protein